jgi:hypothetical protein
VAVSGTLRLPKSKYIWQFTILPCLPAGFVAAVQELIAVEVENFFPRNMSSRQGRGVEIPYSIIRAYNQDIVTETIKQ